MSTFQLQMKVISIMPSCISCALSHIQAADEGSEDSIGKVHGNMCFLDLFVLLFKIFPFVCLLL